MSLNSAGPADTFQDPDVAALILSRYAGMSALFAQQASPEEVYDYLYWPELVTTGEGLPCVFRGKENLMPTVAEFMAAMGTDCVWTSVDPIIVSGNLASSLMQVSCRYPDAPTVDYRAIYVWQKRGETWKVIHEMLCLGTV